MSRRGPHGPRRKVIASRLRVDRDGSESRYRWWELHLECGHLVERSVEYRVRTERHLLWQPRALSEVRPARQTASCGECR